MPFHIIKIVSSAGVWFGAVSTWYLDDERQVFPGGAVEEQALHGHHLHHPHLLHRHDPPLMLWMLRRHEGDQVLPAHVNHQHSQHHQNVIF